MERVDKLEYQNAEHKENTFYDGPGEYLVRAIAKNIAKVEEFKLIFCDSIDGYKRMDYSIRQLPALRIYNESGHKEFDSWFINGEILIDVIFPANLRRQETQDVQDTLTAAILQQFRRPQFFNQMRESVPGLNELGKDLTYDKSLAFVWNNDMVPLTQITINFRIDLREWDAYLEETYRTKDDPFEQTLENLRRIVTTIQALRDDGTKDMKLEIDQH